MRVKLKRSSISWNSSFNLKLLNIKTFQTYSLIKIYIYIEKKSQKQ